MTFAFWARAVCFLSPPLTTSVRSLSSDRNFFNDMKLSFLDAGGPPTPDIVVRSKSISFENKYAAWLHAVAI